MSTISDSDWDIILRRIHEKRCVPFLGAAVNVSSDKYKGIPLGAEVATQLVKKLARLEERDLQELAKAMAGSKDRYLPSVFSVEHDLAQVFIHQKLVERGLDKDLARLALENLARVALHAEVVYRGDYDYFITVLRGIIADAGREPSKLLRTLAPLPCGLIVTTNYDRLMEQALEEIERPYELVEQPIAGFDPDEQVELQARLSKPGGVILYKIHGTFPEAKTEAEREEEQSPAK
ncbi:MAG TPA: SIR2 family protein, partial [Pyrinomonadaceae bacterium]